MYIYTNFEVEHYEIEYMNMQFMRLYEYVNIWNYTIYIQLWIYIYMNSYMDIQCI